MNHWLCSYGETKLYGTDEGNPIQYTARENDQTGLYYYRARYYDPQLNRFISEDPIGIAGGLNVYAYVEGNPVSNVDPHGLTPATAAEGAAIGGALGGPAGAIIGGVIGAGLGVVGANLLNDIINDDVEDDSNEEEGDCGCWRILERRNSWWDGDYITYEYLECLRECKEKNDC